MRTQCDCDLNCAFNLLRVLTAFVRCCYKTPSDVARIRVQGPTQMERACGRPDLRLLLVEDDRMLADALRQALQDSSYAVDWIDNAEAAVEILSTHEYQALILDLNLPKGSGLHILELLRRRGDRVPVLIISARDTIGDRVLGLDAGADDFIVKPFEARELLARLRAVTRRKAGNPNPLLSSGYVFLDLATREATAGEKKSVLSSREFALLRALLLRPGAILSRPELEERIYGWNEEVESNAVEFLIHSVRRKLGPDVIKNIRGLGWTVPKLQP